MRLINRIPSLRLPAIVAFVLFAAMPQLAICAKRSVEVNLEADFVPEKAVGIIMTPDGVVERPALNIKQVRENIFVVSVQL